MNAIPIHREGIYCKSLFVWDRRHISRKSVIETYCKKIYVWKIGQVKNCIGNCFIERRLVEIGLFILDNRSARVVNCPGMCMIVSLILF